MTAARRNSGARRSGWNAARCAASGRPMETHRPGRAGSHVYVASPVRPRPWVRLRPPARAAQAPLGLVLTVPGRPCHKEVPDHRAAGARLLAESDTLHGHGTADESVKTSCAEGRRDIQLSAVTEWTQARARERHVTDGPRSRVRDANAVMPWAHHDLGAQRNTPGGVGTIRQCPPGRRGTGGTEGVRCARSGGCFPTVAGGRQSATDRRGPRDEQEHRAAIHPHGGADRPQAGGGKERGGAFLADRTDTGGRHGQNAHHRCCL